MTEEENQEIVRLERLNLQLADSLQNCRNMLRDYRSKLTANDAKPPEVDEEEQASALAFGHWEPVGPTVPNPRNG